MTDGCNDDEDEDEEELGVYISSADKDRLVKRLRAGETESELAREFGVPIKVVRQWARQERRRVGVGTNGRSQIDPGPDDDYVHENDRREPWPPPPRVPVVGWLREEVTEDPYLSVGRSVRNHWRVIGAITAAALVLALAFGLSRTPKYTAEARLVVGKTIQLNNLAATPGLAVASQQLASDYSRLVSTRSVFNDAAKRLGRPAGDVGGGLSASPIPQSPVIKLQGTASTSDGAVAIANAGAASLVDAVNELNGKQLKSAQQLLDQYRQADNTLVRDQQTLKSLQDRLAKEGDSAPQSLKDQVLAAQTAVDADQLNVNAIASDYEGAISPGQLNEQVVQRVGGASETGNDRNSVLQIALVVGLVAGLLVGVGVATLLESRSMSRKRSARDAVAAR